MTPILGNPVIDDATACRVLAEYVRVGDGRLLYGSRVRLRMQRQLEHGEQPKGYRAQWLTLAGVRIVKELRQLAQEFNRGHSFDQASGNDLLDILMTAKMQLEEQFGIETDDE